MIESLFTLPQGLNIAKPIKYSECVPLFECKRPVIQSRRSSCDIGLSANVYRVVDY